MFTDTYTEFDGTIADLKKLTVDLVGVELTLEYEGERGTHPDRRRILIQETLLIGHVNADDGGGCGCCGSFRDTTRVLRYRRVYNPSLTPQTVETDLGPVAPPVKVRR